VALSWLNLPCALKAAIVSGKRTLGDRRARGRGRERRHPRARRDCEAARPYGSVQVEGNRCHFLQAGDQPNRPLPWYAGHPRKCRVRKQIRLAISSGTDSTLRRSFWRRVVCPQPPNPSPIRRFKPWPGAGVFFEASTSNASILHGKRVGNGHAIQGEAASFRRTACAHSSSILKYRATAFAPTSKGCASPGWRSLSILSLVAAPLNWD